MAITLRRIVAFVGLALISAPAPAAAQRDEFFDALLPLYHAAAGTYGDEGVRLNRAAIDLVDSLQRRNATLRETEARLRSQLQTATGAAALQVHTLLASTYLEHGRFVEALREFDQDLAIDPTRPAFHRFKGVINQALGKRTEAADAFREAWLLEPRNPLHAYHLLVNPSSRTTAAEREQARLTLSALALDIAERLPPKADAPFLSIRPIDDDAKGAMAFAPAAYAPAMAKLLNGQLDSGLTDLRTVVTQDPLVIDPALHSEQALRGIAALRNGQVGEALEMMRAVVALFPASSEAHRLLATVALVNGDIGPSLDHLREALRLNPKNERAWIALTTTLDDVGEWADEAGALHTAIKELPESGELQWQLLMLSAERQRSGVEELEAIANVDRLTLLAGNSELYTRVARLAEGHLDYERSLALLQQAVVLTPNRSSAHQALGRAYIDQGREEEGLAELVMALWLDPTSANALTAIGRLHLTSGRYDEAVTMLTRAVSIDPAEPQSVHALGEALARAGRTAAAQQHIDAAARLQERAVEAQRRARTAGMLSLQAEVERSQSRLGNAIDLWRQAVALASRDVPMRLQLAGALMAANRTVEAVAELEQIAAMDTAPDPHRRLAEAYGVLGRSEDRERERRLYTQARLQQLKERSGDAR